MPRPAPAIPRLVTALAAICAFLSGPAPSACGALRTRYIHGPGLDNLLAKTDATGTLYYHQDALGSAVALTTAAGAVAETYTYTPFGAPTIRDPAGNTLPSTQHNNRFLFTGREYLAALQIYDYRNRHYSPELGRFLQTDPIRFDAGDVNLYRYVGNNPGLFNDPLGLCCEEEKDALDAAQKAFDKTKSAIDTASSMVSIASSAAQDALATIGIATTWFTLSCGAYGGTKNPVAGASCAAAAVSLAYAISKSETAAKNLTNANNKLVEAKNNHVASDSGLQEASRAYQQCMQGSK